MRFDIQLLRVIAVGSVIAAHYFPGRLPGGFVGVDIFFVISGYLMATHLLNQATATGTVSVVRFWLMRATRLFPQAFTVVILTSVALYSLLPTRDQIAHLPDAIFAAVFAENLLLAFESQDYFASVQETSALQHYWSLAVEEQFYIFLPLLLWLSFAIGARARSNLSAPQIVGVISLIAFIASLIYSQYLLEIDPIGAYYWTFSRIWELVLGVLVALARHLSIFTLRSQWWTFGGFNMMFSAIALFDAHTPFPGLSALMPTLGTALILLARPLGVVEMVGRFGPLRWVAEHSYGIYLWHWPVITLVKQVSGENPETWVKVALIALSLFGAWLTTRFLEEPIRRRGRKLVAAGENLKSIGFAVVLAMGLTIALPTAAYFGAVGSQARELAVAQNRFEERKPLLEGELPLCLGPAELDPEAKCLRDPDGFNFFPSTAAAEADDDNRKECWSTSDSQRFNLCDLGELSDYTHRVFVVGDSHAAAYLGAFDLLGKEQNWKITFSGKGGCFWTHAPLKKPQNLNTQFCVEWREGIQAHLDKSEPYDFLIVTNSARTARGVLTEPGQTFEEPSTLGLVEAWTTQTSRGVPIFAIKDNPFPREEVLDCIDRAVTDPRIECGIPRWDGFEAFDPIVAAVQQVPGAHLIDLSNFFCDEDYCSPIVGGVLVYRDQSHITGTYAKLLVPYLASQINEILPQLKLR